jgi:hypothetical protein
MKRIDKYTVELSSEIKVHSDHVRVGNICVLNSAIDQAREMLKQPWPEKKEFKRQVEETWTFERVGEHVAVCCPRGLLWCFGEIGVFDPKLNTTHLPPDVYAAARAFMGWDKSEERPKDLADLCARLERGERWTATQCGQTHTITLYECIDGMRACWPGVVPVSESNIVEKRVTWKKG